MIDHTFTIHRVSFVPSSAGWALKHLHSVGAAEPGEEDRGGCQVVAGHG